MIARFVLSLSPLRVIYDYTNGGGGESDYSGNGLSELNRVINKYFDRFSLKFMGNRYFK